MVPRSSENSVWIGRREDHDEVAARAVERHGDEASAHVLRANLVVHHDNLIFTFPPTPFNKELLYHGTFHAQF